MFSNTFDYCITGTRSNEIQIADKTEQIIDRENNDGYVTLYAVKAAVAFSVDIVPGGERKEVQ